MYSEEAHVFPILVCLYTRPAYAYILVLECICLYIHVCIPVRIPMHIGF